MIPLSKILRRTIAVVLPGYRTRLIEQVGGEVARECHASLWQDVRRQIFNMSIPEARGYVRAQAAWAADVIVGPSLDRYALKSTLRAEVLASGVEQLIAMIVRDSLGEALTTDVKTIAA
jgi:hypothetical protein